MKRALFILFTAAFPAMFSTAACGDGEPDISMTGGNSGTGAMGGEGTGGGALVCGSQQAICDGVCTNTKSDPAHCGACGNECGAGEGCAAGQCRRFGCTTGQVECAESCTNLQTDPANCGACSASCGGGELCVQGDCADSCPEGLVACNGTCIDPLSSRDYCGATECGVPGEGGASGEGTACATNEQCVDGACEKTCAAGQIVCGGNCVSPSLDPNYCGATDCSDPSTDGEICGGGTVCVSGECVTSCPVGQLVCNGRCISPDTDPSYCGATDCSDASSDGEVCVTGHVCSAGQCALNCPPNQVICDGQCRNPQNDRAYCGADSECEGGTVCASGEVCADGICDVSCPTGQLECSGRCVNPLTDSAYCGATDCSGTGGTVCGAGSVCVIGECRQFIRQWEQGERVDTLPTRVETEGSLAADAAGNAIALYRQEVIAGDTTSYRPFAAFYQASTKTWQTPIQLDDRPNRVRNLVVDLNDAGVAVAAWTADIGSGQSQIVMARFNGSSWSYPSDLGGPVAETPSVFVANSGEALVVYSREVDDVLNGNDPDWQAFGHVVSPLGVVSDAIALSDFTGAAYGAFNPKVAGNANGDAVVVYWNGVAPRNVYAVHYSPTTGFAAPSAKVVLNTPLAAPYGRGGPPDAAMDALGNIYVLWHQTSGAYIPSSTLFPTTGAIFQNTYDADTQTWGTASQLTNHAGVAVDPRISTNAGGQIGVAYQVYTIGAVNTAPTDYAVWGARLVGTALSNAFELDSGNSAPPPLPVVAVSGTNDVHLAWTSGGAIETTRYLAGTGAWRDLEVVNTNNAGSAQWPMITATSGANVLLGWLQPVSGLPTAGHLFVARYD